MSARLPTPSVAALGLVLFVSACAVVTGLDGYTIVDRSSSTGRSDGGHPGGTVVPMPTDGGALPPKCSDGQIACATPTTAAACVGNAWKTTACDETCEDGVCKPHPSCRNAAGAGCGVSPRSCCASLPVPGGSFERRTDATLPATVGAFELDAFEVTVGRFRAFVEDGGATQAHRPTAGSGAHPLIADSGWHDEWDARLPIDTAALTASLTGGKATWTDVADTNEHLPINDVQWLEAFAFCAWDGGRLPTYAELNFAASGGSDQRVYPWSTPPTDTTLSQSPAVQAAYDCNFKLPIRYCSTTCSGCDLADIAPVGSLPAGVGKWGQLDLSGNVAELTLDISSPPAEATPPPVCNDCAVILTTDPERAVVDGKQFTAEFYIVGGAWDGSAGDLQTTTWRHQRYDARQDSAGFRCARSARPAP